METAIVLLTRFPDPYMISYFAGLKCDGYKLFIVVDDNSFDSSHYETVDVSFITMNNEVCYNSGFRDSSFTLGKSICAWDKALFHFCSNHAMFSHVWFVEDDVLIPTHTTIRNIDLTYPNADLLSASNFINTTGELDWHWRQVKGKHPLPWAASMICACRLSSKLLNHILGYVLQHKTLIFIEAMFNTIAIHHDCIITNPPELKGIVYQHNWQMSDIKPSHLYHPVKDLNRMKMFHAATTTG